MKKGHYIVSLRLIFLTKVIVLPKILNLIHIHSVCLATEPAVKTSPVTTKPLCVFLRQFVLTARMEDWSSLHCWV